MAERKRPRRTPERIVQTALTLFNRDGEPHVTTADIAAEMGISPGNLYYHFRNKDAIVTALFGLLEQRLDRLLAIPVDRDVDVEDLWLFLHLWFEAMGDYRFIYRDLDEILSRNIRIAVRFRTLMQHATRTVVELSRSMVASGTMQASDRELAALADNAVVIATYWMSYQKVFSGYDATKSFSLDRAAYQVLSLIAPFMIGSSRVLLDRLGRDYL